jgi:hypothetical protein
MITFCTAASASTSPGRSKAIARRAPGSERAFTVLNKMARVSASDPAVRRMLVTGPLEQLIDHPKARALARKHLSTVAQGYLEGLCE